MQKSDYARKRSTFNGGGTNVDLLLKGKSVIVTGASQGLGKAIATEFANEGAKVIISSRNEDKLRIAVEDIQKSTGNRTVSYAICDMRNKVEIESLVQQVISKNDTIDVLINNAGGPPAGEFMEMDDEQWLNAFEQNLMSVVRTSKAVIPYMQKQGAGRIVNITSSSMKQSIDGLVLSNVMRPGVLGLTKTLARELAKDRILVNTVGPGKIATDRMIELNEGIVTAKGKTFQEVMAASVADIPFGRYGEPEEFAKAVVFLASFANSYITGQSLIVDGASVNAL